MYALGGVEMPRARTDAVIIGVKCKEKSDDSSSYLISDYKHVSICPSDFRA